MHHATADITHLRSTRTQEADAGAAPLPIAEATVRAVLP